MSSLFIPAVFCSGCLVSYAIYRLFTTVRYLFLVITLVAILYLSFSINISLLHLGKALVFFLGAVFFDALRLQLIRLNNFFRCFLYVVLSVNILYMNLVYFSFDLIFFLSSILLVITLPAARMLFIQDTQYHGLGWKGMSWTWSLFYTIWNLLLCYVVSNIFILHAVILTVAFLCTIKAPEFYFEIRVYTLATLFLMIPIIYSHPAFVAAIHIPVLPAIISALEVILVIWALIHMYCFVNAHLKQKLE